MDVPIAAKYNYGVLRKEWNTLFDRQKQIVGLLDEILKSQNLSFPKHEDSKKALEKLAPESQSFNLEKIAINQKQIKDMMAEAEDFQKKREQIDAEKEIDRKIQNEKLDLEQKRQKRLLSSGTFKHLQYLESEEWGKLNPTRSPQSRRRRNKEPKTPKALITSLEKELESFEESLQMFNSLQQKEEESIEEEEILDVGAKLALSPSDWTSLEPVRRRNRISKCRRFIQNNVSKNNWLSDELQHMLINDPAPQPDNNNNNSNSNNNFTTQDTQDTQDEEGEPKLELLSLDETKKLMQNMASKLKILKQQYADEAKKSLQYRNEVMKVEAEKLDLVEHFSSLLERKDIELNLLQSQPVDPEDELGSTYYDDVNESVTHPQVPSPNIPKPAIQVQLSGEDEDFHGDEDDDATFLDLLAKKQQENNNQQETDFDLLDLEDEDEFKTYLDKLAEKDTQEDKSQDARSLYNQLFADNNPEPDQPEEDEYLVEEEEAPAKPNEEGAAYPYLQEQEVYDEEIEEENDDVIDPSMVNLDSEEDLDWLLEKVQQENEGHESDEDITVS